MKNILNTETFKALAKILILILLSTHHSLQSTTLCERCNYIAAHMSIQSTRPEELQKNCLCRGCATEEGFARWSNREANKENFSLPLPYHYCDDQFLVIPARLAPEKVNAIIANHKSKYLFKILVADFDIKKLTQIMQHRGHRKFDGIMLQNPIDKFEPHRSAQELLKHFKHSTLICSNYRIIPIKPILEDAQMITKKPIHPYASMKQHFDEFLFDAQTTSEWYDHKIRIKKVAENPEHFFLIFRNII